MIFNRQYKGLLTIGLAGLKSGRMAKISANVR